MQNIEKITIENFGKEWNEFNQRNLPISDNLDMFEKYFNIFPLENLNKNSIVLDAGCGSGRWAFFMAPRVKNLICADPSNAINVAKKNLEKFKNVNFLNESIKDLSIKNNSIDFCYCLGVLHHTNDVKNNLKNLVNKLKMNSPILLYIYYNLENRSFFYKFLWKLSDFIRFFISKLPFKFKIKVTNLIAYIIYYPLSRISKIITKFGLNSEFMPLSYYKDKHMEILKNDSHDRFGTIIEKRYSKSELKTIMEDCGLNNIQFDDTQPFWCVLGYKK